MSLILNKDTMFMRNSNCYGVTQLVTNLIFMIFYISPLKAQGSNMVETYGVFESCTASMEEAAHANLEMWGCEPRDQIAGLELPNATFFHMLPNHVRVKRCGGTCSTSV